MSDPGVRPVTLDLSTEEAEQVFDAVKRVRVRLTARAAYWKKEGDAGKAVGFEATATILSAVNRRLTAAIRDAKSC